MELLAFIILIAVIALALLPRRRSAAERKGAKGEQRVIKELRRIGFPNLNDIYLPTPDGATQIDHVVRAGNAIIVIETKTYSGSIYGAARSKDWSQSFRRGQNTQIRNPIHQNYKHILAAREAAGAAANIHGLVVMAGDSKFPQGMPEGVIALSELARFLRDAKVFARSMADSEDAWSRISQTASDFGGRKGRSLHKKALATKTHHTHSGLR